MLISTSLTVYSAVNNYKLKHIFCVIFSLFSRSHWSCSDMSSEIFFVKSKLKAKGYQGLSYGELSSFITEIENKKTILQRDNVPFHTAEAG